tara:strand:+ start:35 stop:499 length:465 start_codon:yes stop_codon:yes gene_type:complete
MENNMIDLRTDQDFLEQLASDHFDSGRGATAADIRAAADDIRNLRDYATNLEREIKRASSDIVEAKQTQAADFLFNLIKAQVVLLVEKEVKSQIQSEVDYTICTIEDRIDSLETDVADLNENGRSFDDPKTDEIKDTVKEMIRDGDITVNIDHM